MDEIDTCISFTETSRVMSGIVFIYKRCFRATFETEATQSIFIGFTFFSNPHPTILHESISCSRVSPSSNYIHGLNLVLATGSLRKLSTGVSFLGQRPDDLISCGLTSD